MDFLDACRFELSAVKAPDWAELYFGRSSSRSLFYSDRKIDEVSAGSTAGCSARLLRGRETAFSVASGVERGSAARVLRDVCSSASLKAPSLPEEDFPLGRPDVYFPQDRSFLGDLDALLRRQCPWIRQLSMFCSAVDRGTAVVDAERAVSFHVERCSFGASVILERKGSVERGYSSLSAVGSARDFFDGLDAEKIGLEALDEALKNLQAVECPVGPMPVLLSEEAGGSIIHEACGHGMEADLVFEEQSVFAGKMGKTVASELVTVVDDATLRGLYGSYRFDDEGTPAQRTVLVQNGVLKNYLSDRRTSRLYGVPLTGSGRRQNYASLPQPRMSNTFVLPGTDSRESMLEGIPFGLYVHRMGGGEVNTTTGEFVFEVTQGSLIEKGKITVPVKGASLIGRGIEALKGIRAVGRKIHMEPGTCGKGGQSVPVTDGQPSLLIDGLVVGGTATDR